MNQLAFPVTPANTNMTHGAFLHDPRPIGNGTYTSWPGGVDPSVPLYAGNPVPLSMNTTQSGGKRMGYSRKANRKNSRKANRKNSRKANRKNSRKANRKNSRKANRKASRKNSRKNSRKANRKNSRKNSRKNNRRN